jgi:hypothetical protein
MEAVRSDVLPTNRGAIYDYFTYVRGFVHTLTAAVVSLQPGPNNPEKFKSYLEAEEARLSANLKAVDYIIDGTDTLMLVTSAGRGIEKVGTLQSAHRYSRLICCRLLFHYCFC